MLKLAFEIFVFKKKEENFINMPLVIAIIVSVGYMILTELL